MKIRTSLHIDGQTTQLLVYPVMQETTDHLLLKLAAAIFFHRREPILSPSIQHPALHGGDFTPDLMTVNDHNEITLWVECGKTTTHKMEKIAKRHRAARLVMLTPHPLEARATKDNLPDENWNRWEYLAFPVGDFDRWRQIVRETNDVIGEADEKSMNVVVNEDMYVVDLEKIQ